MHLDELVVKQVDWLWSSGGGPSTNQELPTLLNTKFNDSITAPPNYCLNYMNQLSPQVCRLSLLVAPVRPVELLVPTGLIAASAKALIQRLGAGRVAPTPSETVETLTPKLLHSNS